MSFVDRLKSAGRERYHDRHPFHARMHEGALSRQELALWVQNRYYYQTRIPIKDALILAKSEDPAFRRSWLRRIVDHDGDGQGEGGIVLWRRLALGVGVQARELDDYALVLKGVRRACDGYVELVRRSSLLEAVASSLTEAFAPALMQRRLQAWERHYPWVPRPALDYFRVRISRAEQDAAFALGVVTELATTPELEDRAIAALVHKAGLLWEMLDAIEAGVRDLGDAA